MGTLVRMSIFCGLAVAAFARPAEACSCAMKPAPVAFREADRVFVGRAQVSPLGRGAQIARFRVEESFRGPSRDVVVIVARGIGGSCAFAFTHGTRYIVFARLRPDGTYASYFCDPTAPIDQASETLTFARGTRR